MHVTPSSLTYGLLALVALYVSRAIFTNIAHGRRARRWGAEPAFNRPYKWPFGIDIAKRSMDAASSNDLHNHDMHLFKEIGERLTWRQLDVGTWHHVTADPRNIQAMLATQFKDFEMGPVRLGIFGPLLGSGVFLADGKDWEHSRAMLRPLFARAQISNLDSEEAHLQILLEQFSSEPGSWTDGVDLLPLFFNFTLDAATESLFGESVNSQRLRGADKRAPPKEGHSLRWSSFGDHLDAANVAFLIRFRLFDLYWLYNPKSFRENCRHVHECVDHYVGLALRSEKPPHRTCAPSLLEELAKVTTDPIKLRDETVSLLLAGRDTVAGLLGFIFYHLARHPDIHNKLRKTILDDFGTGRENISLESLRSCTYLQNVLREILRIEAISPENARHANKNTTLPRGGGPDGQSPIYIRKGEEVMYNTRIMQRCPDLWGEDADKFNPDRWDTRKPGWEWLPFSGGPRLCLGQQLAMKQAAYVVVRMLQRYDRMENLDPKPQRVRMSQSTMPVEVRVRFHEAGAVEGVDDGH